MDLKLFSWNEDEYKKFIKFLKESEDRDYIKFNKRLIFTSRDFIGIRMPILKKYAKEISKGNAIEFLNVCKKKYYEEILIRGFVISNIEISHPKFMNFVEQYIKDIDNWALCDCFCSSLKIVKKHQNYFLPYIMECLVSCEEWKTRFAIVMMLDYFLTPEYIDKVLKLCDSISSDCYYVKMAQAWLVSVCYIKFKEETKIYLNHSNLDEWTYNKSIQKIIESKRVSITEKEILKKLKKR